MDRYRIGFVVEQSLGHLTHSQNLEAILGRYSSIDAHWVRPSGQANGLIGRLPVLGSNWTVQAGWQARHGLSELTQHTKIDGLFFHTQVPAVLAQKWVRRYPTIISIDATPKQYDSLGEYYHHARGPEWLERYKFRLNRECFFAARQIVTWSKWAKEGLVVEYDVPPDKIIVIPPGVNTRLWMRPKIVSKSQDVVKVLFVGGDLQRKGGLFLLDAFRKLRQETVRQHNGEEVQVELHLVTRTVVPPEPGLYVYNHLDPNSTELRDLYYQSDIFCLPTQGDCMPMVLAEAGAAGLPIVSTRVAAIPEVVRDEENGFLIDPGNLDQLVAALKRLAEDPMLRRMQGAKSYATIRAAHDAEINAMRLTRLLIEMVDASRHGGTAYESDSVNRIRVH
jgi:glycosyltransferase involved in cell wall biosynthesis